MIFEEVINGLEKDERFDVIFKLQQNFTQWGKMTHFGNKTASELKTNKQTNKSPEKGSQVKFLFLSFFTSIITYLELNLTFRCSKYLFT